VNILGHTYVALAVGNASPEHLLGAVLPDLAPMARVRVRRSDLGGDLAEGVRCHHLTDAAFHAHVDFRAGSKALRLGLAGRDVGQGPARAIGHAGWELLLDGILVGSAVEQAFHRAMEVGEGALGAMSPEDASRWTAFLDRARRSPRLAYDDPAWVADRLHMMLARRPRLRLPHAQVGTVAEELARHAPSVAASGPMVLCDTAGAVGASA
jgi:hypothetical protein